MKKLFSLTKASLMSVYNNSAQKSGTGKKVGYVILFAFLGLYMSAFFGFLAYILYDMLEPIGLKGLVPTLICIAVSMLTLMTSIFAGGGFLFHPKDIQMLLSLPVSHTTVLISKFLGLYFNLLITSAVVCLPTGIIYLILDGAGFVGYLFLVILALTVPLLPLAVGCVFSFIIGLATRRMKHKNVVTIILSVIFFGAFMLLSQNSEKVFEYFVQNGGQLYDALRKWYLPAALMTKAIDGDVLSLLMFIAVSIVPFAIIFPLMSTRYALIAAGGNSSAKKRFTYRASQKSSSFYACLRKELSKVFSSANIFMNTCSGLLMLIVMVIATMAKSPTDDAASILPMIITLLAVFATTMTSTTSSSISLEAKTLWIYKTSPVDIFTVFKAKIAVNVIIFLPVTVVTLTVVSIFFGFALLDVIASLLLPAACIFYASVIGLIINLIKPKFNWTSEIQAIKSSASVLITMLEGICFTILIGAAIVLPMIFLETPFYVGSIAAALLIFLITIVLVNCLKGWGVRKFEKLF